MLQCIRAFKCTVQGTPAIVTRNPVLGGFVGQESRKGYGYTSINITTYLCKNYRTRTFVSVDVSRVHSMHTRVTCGSVNYVRVYNVQL